MQSSPQLVLVSLVAVAIGNGLAYAAGVGANELLPPGELGPVVIRALLAASLAFTGAVALTIACAVSPRSSAITGRVFLGAVLGLAVAIVFLLAGGLAVEGPLFYAVLGCAQACVVAGAWWGRRRGEPSER